MNPATTTVQSETLTNTIVFTEPFTLFLGRKGRLIEESARLEFSQQYETLSDEEDPFGPVASRVVSEKASLFISDKLYATVQMGQRRKNAHYRMKIAKPTDGGPTQVHLTKRYTRLARP